MTPNLRSVGRLSTNCATVLDEHPRMRAASACEQHFDVWNFGKDAADRLGGA